VIFAIGSAGRREAERVGVFRQKAEFAKAEIEIIVVLEEEAAGAGGEDGHGVVAFPLRASALTLAGDHGTDGHAASGHSRVLSVEAFGVQ
jgi:hypothetical protein